MICMFIMYHMNDVFGMWVNKGKTDILNHQNKDAKWCVWVQRQ